MSSILTSHHMPTARYIHVEVEFIIIKVYNVCAGFIEGKSHDISYKLYSITDYDIMDTDVPK